MQDQLSARNLAKYGLRRGAYDGANRRRFVLFCASRFGTGIEERREYDTKRERDAAAIAELESRKRFAMRLAGTSAA